MPDWRKASRRMTKLDSGLLARNYYQRQIPATRDLKGVEARSLGWIKKRISPETSTGEVVDGGGLNPNATYYITQIMWRFLRRRNQGRLSCSHY